MKIVLELLDQPSNIRRINVRHDIVIGRGSECNLRLSAPQVSRRHCFLRIGRDSASITDLDSSNGTFLNDARIPSGTRCELNDGMTLAVGPIRFLVKVRSEAVAAEVLGDQQLNQSVEVAASRSNRSGSTTIASGDAIVQAANRQNRDGLMQNAQVFSLEHAGDVSESHEETTDFLPEHADPVDVVDEIPLVDEVEVIDDADAVEAVEAADSVEVLDAVDVLDNVDVIEDVELEEVDVVEDVELIEDEDMERVEDVVEVLDDDDSGSNWFADNGESGART